MTILHIIEYQPDFAAQPLYEVHGTAADVERRAKVLRELGVTVHGISRLPYADRYAPNKYGKRHLVEVANLIVKHIRNASKTPD